MIIWRVTGDEIGHNWTGALYCATKAEAEAAVREWVDMNRDQGKTRPVPERMKIETREQLAEALNEATGYGGT